MQAEIPTSPNNATISIAVLLVAIGSSDWTYPLSVEIKKYSQ